MKKGLTLEGIFASIFFGGEELIFGLVLSLGDYYRNITVVNDLVPYS